MLKIIKSENIKENTKISAYVKGKLIKCYFHCLYPNVNIQIENQDHEIILVWDLDQEHFNIYPRKTISLYGETKIEHFYLFPNNRDTNNIFIRILGLEEGQNINMIKILYEDLDLIKTTD